MVLLPAILLLMCIFSSASTTNVVPTGGVSASSTIKSNICSGAMWSCVNDPVGMPDGDSTYVYKDTSGTTGEHVLSFSGSITNITGVTLHIIAATGSGAAGTAQMRFYNNGVIAGTGGAKTLTTAYTEYTSAFTTQVSDINNITMSVTLTNTSSTGILKYTAAWLAVTYGTKEMDPPSGAQSFLNIDEAGTYGGTYNHCLSSDNYQGDTGPTTSAGDNWIHQRDCGTAGDKDGSTQLYATAPQPPGNAPGSLSAPIRSYNVTYSLADSSIKHPGMRFFKHVTSTSDDAQKTFQYDVWLYFANQSSLSGTQVIEMDLNQIGATSNARFYLLGVQCNLEKGIWQITKYVRAQGTSQWKDTLQPCTRNDFPVGSWHHVQIRTLRDQSNAEIVYEKAAIDDNVQHFTCTGGTTCTSDWRSGTGWGVGTLGPNLQLNVQSSGDTPSIYSDNFAIYRW